VSLHTVLSHNVEFELSIPLLITYATERINFQPTKAFIKWLSDRFGYSVVGVLLRKFVNYLLTRIRIQFDHLMIRYEHISTTYKVLVLMKKGLM